jgi:hypothetical protein
MRSTPPPRRGELKRVAVAGRDQHPPAPLFLADCGGGEEIVGLVAGAARIGEAAGGDEFGDDRELLDDLIVEFAPALIGRKGFVPVGLFLQRVPGDNDGARLLVAMEPQQQIGEAENGAGRPLALALDRLRQGVIGAVSERIAVDRQQRAARRFRFSQHHLCPSSPRQSIAERSFASPPPPREQENFCRMFIDISPFMGYIAHRSCP